MTEAQEERQARLWREAEDRELQRDCQVAQATAQNERIALASAKE